jgi:DNA polymerase V
MAVRRLWRPGFNYAKAGVTLVDLQQADAAGQGELDLFAPAEDAVDAAAPSLTGRDRTRLMDAMDTLNRRFGRDAVRIGTQTLASSRQETRSWAIRQERRTPRYTTRWEEMPVVRA